MIKSKKFTQKFTQKVTQKITLQYENLCNLNKLWRFQCKNFIMIWVNLQYTPLDQKFPIT